MGLWVCQAEPPFCSLAAEVVQPLHRGGVRPETSDSNLRRVSRARVESTA